MCVRVERQQNLAPEDIIWAFGTENPASTATDAMLVMHTSSGPTQLSFSGSGSGNSTTTGSAAALGVGLSFGLSVVTAVSFLFL